MGSDIIIITEIRLFQKLDRSTGLCFYFLKNFIYKFIHHHQIRECCFLSQIKQYNEQQTIYKEDDNDGLLTYSHFVLSGQCMILQCLKLKVNLYRNRYYYLKLLNIIYH